MKLLTCGESDCQIGWHVIDMKLSTCAVSVCHRNRLVWHAIVKEFLSSAASDCHMVWFGMQLKRNFTWCSI
jgi:hypothetical protein